MFCLFLSSSLADLLPDVTSTDADTHDDTISKALAAVYEVSYLPIPQPLACWPIPPAHHNDFEQVEREPNLPHVPCAGRETHDDQALADPVRRGGHRRGGDGPGEAR